MIDQKPNRCPECQCVPSKAAISYGGLTAVVVGWECGCGFIEIEDDGLSDVAWWNQHIKEFQQEQNPQPQEPEQ